MIPYYIQKELNKLNEEQKAKFKQLLMSFSSGLPDTAISHNQYYDMLNIVRPINKNPTAPAVPDDSLSPDWEHAPKRRRHDRN